MTLQGGEGFQWDAANAEHATRHGFTIAQVEAALNDPFGVEFFATPMDTEERFGWYGMTNTGALLAIIYTMRGRLVRAIRVRKAMRYERRMYTERRRW